MNTVGIWQTGSTSLEDTLRLGEQVGHNIRGGETIELRSDLGGGKTSFVRGLAHGMGSTAQVRSPSFTLANEYPSPNLTLYHFDFYRLQQPGIMRDEITEVLNDTKSAVVVEWGDIIEDVLPASRLIIRIDATGETSRQMTFEYPEQLKYLTPANT